MKRLLLFILVIMGCCGRFASDAKRCPATPAVVPPVEPLLVRSAVDDVRCRQWVDSVLGTLSLKERIGQLFIYTIAPYQDKGNKELLRKVVEDYKVGGLLFSGGLMQNQAMLTNEAQRMADIPLLITFDGEWGLSMRLRGTPVFPKNMVLGCIQNDTLLYEYGREMARQCRELVGNNSEGMKRIAFDLRGLRDFEIDGAGTELLFSGFVSPFSIEECERIEIHDLKIDYTRTFHSEGIVRAAGDGWLEVSFPGEYRCEEVNGCLHFYDERGTDYPYSNLLEFDAVRCEPAFRAHDYWIAGGTIPARRCGNGPVL